MLNLKKFGIYLILAALLAGFAGMLFSPLIGDCVGVLRTGACGATYLMAAAGDGDEIAVLGMDGDDLILVYGNGSGNRTARTRLDMTALPDRWRAAAFYPDGAGACFLGVYSLDESFNAEKLRLYQIAGRQTRLLLERDCAGATTAEQMNSVRLSGFSRTDGVVSFVLLEGDSASVYRTMDDGSGLTQAGTFRCGPAQAACVLADGQVVYASGSQLFFSGTGESYTYDSQIITDFRQVGAGIYTVDRAGLEVFYTDLTSPQRYQPVLPLEKGDYDLNGVADCSVTEDGGLLLLLSDGRLVLDRGTTVQDLTGMLYRSKAQCVLILLGLALAVLALAFVIWLVVCQWRGMRISLLLRWGVLLAAVAVLGVCALLHGTIRPAERHEAAARAYELAGSVTSLAVETVGVQSEVFVRVLADSVAAAGGDAARDTVVSVYEKDENSLWRLQDGNTGAVPGTRGELTMAFDRELALLAQQQGVAFAELERGGLPRFCYYRFEAGRLVAVSIGAEALLEQAAASYSQTRTGVWSVAVFLLALSLLAVAWIVIHLRRMAQGMERLNAGESGVRVRIQTGDELESLGSCVNTLAHTMEELERRQEELATSYRRFVPERVLALLGKKNLAEVDKHTFTSRKMATMMVWFRFPQPVYEKSGRELFDNLNEIIERTAPIIAKNGGTVFNFAYDGYDAVFEDDLEDAISTAVAVRQEILAINKERELDGRARVDLRIALDEGAILLGLVGDENQMEPTAISSSFSVAKRLIGLCGKLDATILCTEAVAAHAGQYGSRYVGKCMDGGKAIRTYEIYDGDSYEVRRVKEQTARQFSEGVYMLYSRDFSGAKRIFLNLVHRNVGDGGAKYYLYLADELEKHQEQEISLDYKL